MDFDIDTLLISGGGTKGNIIIGSLKALTENSIIKNDYSNLKNIISCSVGSIIAFFICCGLTPSAIFKLSALKVGTSYALKLYLSKIKAVSY